jgi:hypothetical protein
MRRLAFALIAGALVVVLVVPAALAQNDLVKQARAATARFHSVAQAEQAGYGPFPPGVPLHECIMALDASGGMGLHWLNVELLDARVGELEPEVLVYAPRQGGGLELVALEYVVFADTWAAENGSAIPTVFGQDLTLVPDGNRYEIPAFWQRHIWLYEDNEAGLFADFNPTVSC